MNGDQRPAKPVADLSAEARQAGLDHRNAAGDVTAGFEELDEVRDFEASQSAAVGELGEGHVSMRHVAENPAMARMPEVRRQFGPGGEAVLVHAIRWVRAVRRTGMATTHEKRRRLRSGTLCRSAGRQKGA